MAGRIVLPYRNPKKLGPYTEALREAGLEPVTFTPEEPGSLDYCQGVVLIGGDDINPARYGEAPGPRAQPPDDARDALEIPLVLDALAAGLPLLAICRGHQLLNVALGGSLRQHVDGHAAPGQAEVHTVEVAAGSRLAAITGTSSLWVNSRHHQAIARLAPGLSVSARAPDGTIEAVEVAGKGFAIAVQWHPEDRVRTHAADRRLFEAFAEAVREALRHAAAPR